MLFRYVKDLWLDSVGSGRFGHQFIYEEFQFMSMLRYHTLTDKNMEDFNSQIQSGLGLESGLIEVFKNPII